MSISTCHNQKRRIYIGNRTGLRLFVQPARVVLNIAVLLLLAACSHSNDGNETGVAPEPTPVYTTANTPIGTLVSDPAALEILERYIPQFASGGFLDLIKDSTLKGIQGYGASVLTDEVLAAMDVELAKLTPLSGLIVVGEVNYDEGSVKAYTLPDPLVLSNGAPVGDADIWWDARRPEIYDIYESQVFGRSPPRPAQQHFEIIESATSAFDGKAYRSQIVIHLSNRMDGPRINLIQYLPAVAKLPAPVLLVAGFAETTQLFGDSDIGGVSSQVETLRLLDAGFAVAGINYLELDPDDAASYPNSLRAFFDNMAGPSREPDAWGATAAWGWGLSRAQDFLETDPMVDSERVAIFGASRLGRAVLWAAARDQRFAAVIACCSGKPGASLMRRHYGETLRGDNSYWYAQNLNQYVGDKVDTLPVDSHMLLALIAPRPALLQTGRYDHAADPKGEFLAAVAAEPVYTLLGAGGLGVPASAWPPEGPIVNDLSYYMHEGGHGYSSQDWDVFLAFLKKHLE